jgi:hypothetical protein
VCVARFQYSIIYLTNCHLYFAMTSSMAMNIPGCAVYTVTWNCWADKCNHFFLPALTLWIWKYCQYLPISSVQHSFSCLNCSFQCVSLRLSLIFCSIYQTLFFFVNFWFVYSIFWTVDHCFLGILYNPGNYTFLCDNLLQKFSVGVDCVMTLYKVILFIMLLVTYQTLQQFFTANGPHFVFF